jgi:hypothetical protein
LNDLSKLGIFDWSVETRTTTYNDLSKLGPTRLCSRTCGQPPPSKGLSASDCSCQTFTVITGSSLISSLNQLSAHCHSVVCRVARWFIFKPKIPVWVNFGVPYIDWKMFIYLMVIWTFGIFYDHLVCTFCSHLVHFFRFWYHVGTKKIWQPWLYVRNVRHRNFANCVTLWYAIPVHGVKFSFTFPRCCLPKYLRKFSN